MTPKKPTERGGGSSEQPRLQEGYGIAADTNTKIRDLLSSPSVARDQQERLTGITETLGRYTNFEAYLVGQRANVLNLFVSSLDPEGLKDQLADYFNDNNRKADYYALNSWWASVEIEREINAGKAIFNMLKQIADGKYVQPDHFKDWLGRASVHNSGNFLHAITRLYEQDDKKLRRVHEWWRANVG